MMTVPSPLTWVGGKAGSAKHVVAAFPPPQSYGTSVEVFGGAAHVLFAKAPGRHLPVVYGLGNARPISSTTLSHCESRYVLVDGFQERTPHVHTRLVNESKWGMASRRAAMHE